MKEKNPLLNVKDFEETLDLGEMIIIPPGVEIKIDVGFQKMKGFGDGDAYFKETRSVFFKKQECFLIPSDQFAKILAHAKITLQEKDDEGKGRTPDNKPGNTRVH